MRLPVIANDRFLGEGDHHIKDMDGSALMVTRAVAREGHGGDAERQSAGSISDREDVGRIDKR
ncbi:hypothetical protein EJ06DRAFT_137727 [Trichodelitschia bisporula]|uniref:Uncharacterized protein n=1 Tax=Trichodelitschia bisporula TaxID=703511 RepID=A0A6G1HPC6_9PEZI|nr:hypothetical protein EJ06DRAFT_137727 [Trichodelitschia bisporula]